jgi:hypothetical protein
LGERLLCKQEVIGSIPFTSTTDRTTRGSVVRVEARQRRSGARESAKQGDVISGKHTRFAGGFCAGSLIFDR